MATEVEYDIPRATAAVQFLVDDPYAVARYKALRKAITQPRRLPYKDEAEMLNELIKIGRQSPVALEKLIAVAEFKRNLSDVSYMASFMSHSRRRVKDTLQIEQTMLGQTYTHEERYEAEHRVKAQWAAEKEAFLVKAQEEYGAGKLPHDQKIAMTRQFWARVDTLIEELKVRAETVKSKIEAPRKRKVTLDMAIPESEMAQKLNKAFTDAEKLKLKHK